MLKAHVILASVRSSFTGKRQPICELTSSLRMLLATIAIVI